MKVLVVTNMYPDAERPYNGIFVAEQIAAIERFHPDVHTEVCFIDGEKGKSEYLKSVGYVNQLIRKGNYDLVHIHFGVSGMYLLSPFKLKVPTIATFHGSDIQPEGGNGWLTIHLSRFVAKKADACITLNKRMDSIVKLYNRKTFVVPCSVDMDLFKPMNIKKQGNSMRIVFPCNRSMWVKDFPLFERVIKMLKTQYGIDCKGETMENLSRPQVAELMNTADLLLMTSFSEGSPQAVKEALACNLPVVSTPVGDVNVLLNGVKDCYVAETRDAEELAKLVVKALQRNGHGTTGRERLTKLHLDQKSVADKIYNIYEQSLH